MSGIFVTRGSTLSIPSFTMTLSDLSNSPVASMTLHVGLDVYPLWLRSAIMQARLSEEAARRLDEIWDGSGDSAQIDLLEQELFTSMGAITAAAAAIDAFYGSVRDRCPSSGGVHTPGKRHRGRERIILATFQQRFVFPAESVRSLEVPLRDIFLFRRLGLHAHGRPEQAVTHPRLKTGMSRKHVIFRAQNAVAATDLALKLIGFLSTRPRSRYTSLRKLCMYAREWLEPLISDWEADHPRLGLPLPLTEHVPPTKRERKSALRKSSSGADQHD